MTAYNVIDPGKLVAGQPEDISVLLANLQAIAAVINGALDNANLSPSAALAISKLAGYPADGSKVLLGDGTWGTITTGGGTGVPAGTVLPYAAAAAPSGFLLCDGSAVSRSTYSALFALVGSLYGSGDGSTTFNVPDLRGRVIAGYAASGAHADVSTLGNNEGNTVGNRRVKHQHTNQLTPSHNLTLPSHGHSVSDPGHTHNWRGGASGSDSSGNFREFGDGSGIGNAAGAIVQQAATGISVGNPTSNPPINGSVTLGGAIGVVTNTPMDSPAYAILNHIIKT